MANWSTVRGTNPGGSPKAGDFTGSSIGPRGIHCRAEISACPACPGVGGNGRDGTGEQTREAGGAVAGQFHQVGDLAKGGFDPVAPLGDDLPGSCRAAGPWWRDQHAGTAAAQETANALPLKPLSVSRPGGGGQAFGGLVAASRSLTAAGTMPHVRTMPLPRPVLMASRNP